MTKVKRLVSLTLAMLMMSTSMFCFAAENNMTVEEAKAYLANYEEVLVGENGKETVFKYNFPSDEALTAAAEYIHNNGLEAFNALVDNAILKDNEENSGIMPYTANPLTEYQTVSGNGKHTVSAYVTGIAYFKKIAATEYVFDFSYNATVQNNQFTTLSGFSVKNFHSAANTSIQDITYNHYVNGNKAGVTVNYKIVRSVPVSVSDAGFDFDILEEYDMDSFALLLTLK